jgi:hypothetical protein
MRELIIKSKDFFIFLIDIVSKYITNINEYNIRKQIQKKLHSLSVLLIGA